MRQQFVIKGKIVITILLLIFWSGHSLAQISSADKNRLIVTTDLGGTDPDDIQSMIHLLLCSNVIDIEGLISSQVWMDDPDKTERIRTVVEQFGEVLPHLQKHAKGYPSLSYLRSIIKRGQKTSNMSGVGSGKDSQGSELIITAVDKKNDDRPVWIVAWGGMNTLAQALWKVRETRSKKAIEKFISKIRIYDILGQDDAGAWIAKNFPEITYIRNTKVYGWAPNDEWIDNNIQNRLPLGSHYPDRKWATEGDSPSFLYVYANGLNCPEHVDYGGWGGRFSAEKTAGIRGMSFIQRSGKDESQYDDYFMHASTQEGVNAINKWRDHIWNNFAARMLWTTTDDYSAANHHPTVVVNGDGSLRCIYKKAKTNTLITLSAKGSNDPDGNILNYKWHFYKEPSSYKGNISIVGEDKESCQISIPGDASGKNIHIILEVSDNGTPSLTAYRRIVINVR